MGAIRLSRRALPADRVKALGWRQRLVIRQVVGESLVQGALGGLLGVASGVAGAAMIDAVGPTLEASVDAEPTGGIGAFGQGTIAAGSADVVLGAPVVPGLVVLAVGGARRRAVRRRGPAGCGPPDSGPPRRCGARSDR